MRMTKTDMAQVIVTALYNRPALVRPSDPRVVAMVRRNRTATLAQRVELALRVIEQQREEKAQ